MPECDAITPWWRRLFRRRGLYPGWSERQPDGSTLTYLGKAADPWDERVCRICRQPASQYKTLPPWPGTSYSHTTMTCDEHASYLDGKCWGRRQDGTYYEFESSWSSCATCQGPYGECSHTDRYAAMSRIQEAGAVRGRVHQEGQFQ